MESDGTIATAVARKGGRDVAVDRKALFIVEESWYESCEH